MAQKNDSSWIKIKDYIIDLDKVVTLKLMEDPGQIEFTFLNRQCLTFYVKHAKAMSSCVAITDDEFWRIFTLLNARIKYISIGDKQSKA